jgi:serine O-acetyltransferase
VIRELLDDARQLARAAGAEPGRGATLRTALTQDSYWILALWRLRCAARRYRIPLVNHLLRRVQSVVFGIELGNGITLGRGVYFLHPIGIVVGGNARIGDRVRLMGSNTVGTAKDNGYPVVGDDVTLGAGARVLGPVTIGARCVIGANAVVLSDVAPDSVAVGLPARTLPGASPGPPPPATPGATS